MKRRSIWRLAVVLLAAGLVSVAAWAASRSGNCPTSHVPEEYHPVYRVLCAHLDGFERNVKRAPNRGRSRPTFGTHLLVADSNRGPVLLEPGTLPGVEVTLDRMRELGIEGITLAIGYPILTADFPDVERYRAFYAAVAAAVRRRGMRLAVEQIILFVNSQFSPWEIDLSALTFEQFVAQQRQMAQTIIDALAPDYLTILHEPDTYAVLTGLEEFHDPQIATTYVESILDGLRRGTTKVGAGAVNYNDVDFFVKFARTDVDYLDVHLYNVDRRSVRNAQRIARIARRRGKALVLSEAWLYKTDGTDVAAQANLIGWGEGFRRDVFGFWEPLDMRFHDALSAFARRGGVEYVSPFWSNYYFAYLEYGPGTAGLTYRELVTQLAPPLVADAIGRGTFTGTGLRFRDAIARTRQATASLSAPHGPRDDVLPVVGQRVSP